MIICTAFQTINKKFFHFHRTSRRSREIDVPRKRSLERPAEEVETYENHPAVEKRRKFTEDPFADESTVRGN